MAVLQRICTAVAVFDVLIHHAAACTAPGEDPYETGNFEACCSGSTKELVNDGRWHYVCNALPTPAPPTPPPTPCIDPELCASATLVQTARDTGDRLQKQPDVNFEPDFDSSIVVDVGSMNFDQTIMGFGGAFTEASALVFQSLNADLQREIISNYYGSDGIGYTTGRVPINSCDFSPASYTFDEVDSCDKDSNLPHFDTNVTHDTEAIIPLIKAAMEEVEKSSNTSLKLFASPWSPPKWMKRNNNMLTSPSPGLKDECRGTWANYFVKWISAYKSHGVQIWGVTVQNEPGNSPRWEACKYTIEQEADFLGDYLGPALNSSHPDVKIFVNDDYPHDVDKWAQTVYSHESAKQFATGIAFHWYAGDNFKQVKQVHEAYPEAVLLPSEATYEAWRRDKGVSFVEGQWSFGEGYAHDILNNLNAGAVGWTDWNLLLNQDGGPNHVGNNCDAPMMADTGAQKLYVHSQYWYIGHFSKYLPRGSKRIVSSVSGSQTYSGRMRSYGSCDGRDGLQAVAFVRPDNQIATVVLNCGSNKIDFKLKDGRRSIRAQIPAHSIQTYLFEPIDSKPRRMEMLV